MHALFGSLSFGIAGPSQLKPAPRARQPSTPVQSWKPQRRALAVHAASAHSQKPDWHALSLAQRSPALCLQAPAPSQVSAPVHAFFGSWLFAICPVQAPVESTKLQPLQAVAAQRKPPVQVASAHSQRLLSHWFAVVHAEPLAK